MPIVLLFRISYLDLQVYVLVLVVAVIEEGGGVAQHPAPAATCTASRGRSLGRRSCCRGSPARRRRRVVLRLGR